MTTFGIEGRPDQRTSKTRTYTHAVVGYFSGSKMYDRHFKQEEKQAREDHAYYVRAYHCHQASASNPGYSESTIAHYAEIAALTSDQYVQRRLLALSNRCAKLTGEGALQWSQSEANARKAVGAWAKRHYENLRVVPVIVVKKVKGAPTISETPLTRGW
jgi:hypothetical protein